MRMSDIVDTDTMKVSEVADTVSSAKDNATKCEVSDQSQSSRDEHGSNNKQDMQVKSPKKDSVIERFGLTAAWLEPE